MPLRSATCFHPTLHVSRFIVSRTNLKLSPALDLRHRARRFQPHPAAPIFPHPLYIPVFLAFLPYSQNAPRALKSLGLLFFSQMDLLGAPLEALAFRYSAAVVVGSLWAWFAVLAAALGLWRIRAALPPPPKPPGLLDPTGAEAVSAPPSAPVLIEPSPSCNADGIARPKARFMAYFHADDGSDEKERGDGVSDGDDGEETEKKEDALWGWERRLVRNGGDLGWYSYQDRTAFNGSVVRLWDGNVRLTATAGRVRRLK